MDYLTEQEIALWDGIITAACGSAVFDGDNDGLLTKAHERAIVAIHFRRKYLKESKNG